MSAPSGKKSRILLVGPGGIGGLYASRLQASRVADVTLVCRSNYVQVSRNGFQVKSVKWGDYHYKPHHVVKTVQDSEGIFDYVVVCTKALPEFHDIPETVSPLLQRSKDTCVVLIQNGIGIEQGFADHVPIISVVAYVGVSQNQPGEIKHTALGKLVLGEYRPTNAPTPEILPHKLKEFSEALKTGGVETEVHDNIQIVRWHKLLWNATFNPISILCGGLDTAQMLAQPDIENSILATMGEIQDLCFKVTGITAFPQELWDGRTYINVTKNLVSGYKPSMLLDFEEKRPMEVEAIIGNILKIARNHNQEMPRLQIIYALISSVSKYKM